MFLKSDCECDCAGYITNGQDVPVCSRCGTPWILDLGGLLKSFRDLQFRVQQLEEEVGVKGQI